MRAAKIADPGRCHPVVCIRLKKTGPARWMIEEGSIDDSKVEKLPSDWGLEVAICPGFSEGILERACPWSPPRGSFKKPNAYCAAPL
jgi:hypothetical protein